MALGQGERSLIARFGRLGEGLLFFVLFYLYLWLVVDLRLIYTGGGLILGFPAFYRGWDFFFESVLHPGGAVEYAAAFLSQFFKVGWLGSLVVTAQAFMLYIFTDLIIKSAGARWFRWIRFAGPILLIAVYGQYAYHLVAATLSVTAALGLAVVYVRFGRAKAIARVTAYCCGCVVLYLAAGGACIVFSVVCAIFEALFRKEALLGILYLAAGIAINYVTGVMLFGMLAGEAFTRVTPLHWRVLYYDATRGMAPAIYLMYLMVPVAMLASVVLGYARSSLPRKGDNPERGQEQRAGFRKVFWWFLGRPWIRWAAEVVVFLSVAAGVGIYWHNEAIKSHQEVAYHSSQHEWSKVIKAAEADGANSIMINAVNRALYHEGRLCDDMFSYPQMPGMILFARGRIPQWRQFDTYLDLGHLNLAEHALAQSVAINGEQPLLLKRLALINMVKGNVGTAKVYLAALNNTLFETQWAREYQERIRTDPMLSKDTQVTELRRKAVELNRDSRILVETLLLDLLEKDERNRMAFEYLMAHYLQTLELEKFVANLWRLDDIGYEKLPRSYEEAILLYTSMKKKEVDLGGRQISLESRRRYGSFVWVLNQHRANKQAAFEELAKQLGDSYFFYFVYGQSGLRR